MNNTPQIDREALRRDGWQVIETEEEKRAAWPCRDGDEYLYDLGSWVRSANWRREDNDFSPLFVYRRRIPSPATPPAAQWISTKDRLPTEADADDADLVWTLAGFNSKPEWRHYVNVANNCSHWAPRIKQTPPPLPVKEPAQEELDRKLALASWRSYDDGADCHPGQVYEDGFIAGLRAGRAGKEGAK